jgi:hypothetical protein
MLYSVHFCLIIDHDNVFVYKNKRHSFLSLLSTTENSPYIAWNPSSSSTSSWIHNSWMYLELNHWLQWSLMSWSRFSYFLANLILFFPSIHRSAPKDSPQLSEITPLTEFDYSIPPSKIAKGKISPCIPEAHYCVRHIWQLQYRHPFGPNHSIICLLYVDTEYTPDYSILLLYRLF